MFINNQSNLDYSYTLPDGTVVSGNQPSNIVQTEVISGLLPKIKSGDKTFLRAGETSVHSVLISNNSTTATVTGAVFRDSMSAGASYVPNSVTVNGIAQPGFDPVAGFSIPDIPPGGSASVSYVIQADSPITEQQVQDFATLNYTVVDPISGPRQFQENTNTLTVILVNAELLLIKTVDRAVAEQGDILRYAIQVRNTGNAQINDLTFFDPIPVGSTFIAGSVRVNGASLPGANPGIGFPIPDLQPGGVNLVEFDVTVN